MLVAKRDAALDALKAKAAELRKVAPETFRIAGFREGLWGPAQ